MNINILSRVDMTCVSVHSAEWQTFLPESKNDCISFVRMAMCSVNAILHSF